MRSHLNFCAVAEQLVKQNPQNPDLVYGLTDTGVFGLHPETLSDLEVFAPGLLLGLGRLNAMTKGAFHLTDEYPRLHRHGSGPSIILETSLPHSLDAGLLVSRTMALDIAEDRIAIGVSRQKREILYDFSDSKCASFSSKNGDRTEQAIGHLLGLLCDHGWISAPVIRQLATKCEPAAA